jgi:hypothetical protein
MIAFIGDDCMAKEEKQEKKEEKQEKIGIKECKRIAFTSVVKPRKEASILLTELHVLIPKEPKCHPPCMVPLRFG